MPVLTERKKREGFIPPPSWPGGDGEGGPRDSGSSFPISKWQVGLWILIAGIVMLFAGLSSAYIVLRGVPGWQNVEIPSILWMNTTILLASSATIEASRRSLRHDRIFGMKAWLLASGVFGLMFLIGQFVAWRQLVAAGVYLPSTLHSSFFFVLTGLHGFHLLGGVGGLSIVLTKALRDRITPAKEEPLKLCAIYWHFMDALWVYLFVLLVLA
jgi:cytochrome c oxidase subunit 3